VSPAADSHCCLILGWEEVLQAGREESSFLNLHEVFEFFNVQNLISATTQKPTEISALGERQYTALSLYRKWSFELGITSS